MHFDQRESRDRVRSYFDRRQCGLFLTLHLWSCEPVLTGATAIAGAIKRAIDALSKVELGAKGVDALPLGALLA
jgi:hypothetical protein